MKNYEPLSSVASGAVKSSLASSLLYCLRPYPTSRWNTKAMESQRVCKITTAMCGTEMYGFTALPLGRIYKSALPGCCKKQVHLAVITLFYERKQNFARPRMVIQFDCSYNDSELTDQTDIWTGFSNSFTSSLAAATLLDPLPPLEDSIPTQPLGYQAQ